MPTQVDFTATSAREARGLTDHIWETMSYSKRHKAFPSLVLVLSLCSGCCHATTVVIAITPRGLIVGTDSGHTVQAPPRVGKAIIVQHRLVVTSVSLVDAELTNTRPPHDGFRYHFTKWMIAVEKKCPDNVSVSQLTSLLEIESRITFKNFDRIIASGTLDRKKTPDPLVEYYVAGYQAGIPTVTHIYFQIDWENRRLMEPIVVEVHPDHNPRADVGFFVGGIHEVGTQIKDRDSDAYKEMFAVMPNELPRILSQQELSLSEATNASLAVLRYEAKHHKPLVAPPFVIVTIPPLGMGAPILTTFRK